MPLNSRWQQFSRSIDAALSTPLLQPRFQYPYPSCIYCLFPSWSPLSFTEPAGMEETLQRWALHAEELVTSSEPSSVRAPVEFFIGIAQLSQSFRPNTSKALPFPSALFSSSAATKIAVSFLVYPTEKKNQEAVLAIQTRACLSDKSWGRMSSGKHSVSLIKYFIFRIGRNQVM